MGKYRKRRAYSDMCGENDIEATLRSSSIAKISHNAALSVCRAHARQHISVIALA